MTERSQVYIDKLTDSIIANQIEAIRRKRDELHREMAMISNQIAGLDMAIDVISAQGRTG